MYRTLAEAATSADAELPYRLRDLLTIPDGQRVSELEALGEPPAQHPGVPAPAGPQDLPRAAR
jgi:hypothetical protein